MNSARGVDCDVTAEGGVVMNLRGVEKPAGILGEKLKEERACVIDAATSPGAGKSQSLAPQPGPPLLPQVGAVELDASETEMAARPHDAANTAVKLKSAKKASLSLDMGTPREFPIRRHLASGGRNREGNPPRMCGSET